MPAVNDEALVRELRMARDTLRGDILRVTLLSECQTLNYPVGSIRVAVVEEPGRTKPMQYPNFCIRCRNPLAYVGLQRG
jgi:hypothetical protein